MTNSRHPHGCEAVAGGASESESEGEREREGRETVQLQKKNPS